MSSRERGKETVREREIKRQIKREKEIRIYRERTIG